MLRPSPPQSDSETTMDILAKNRPLPRPMPAGLVGWFLAVAVPVLVPLWDSDLFAGGVKREQPKPVTKPVPSEGLAALYPGDEGLERDPRVLFVENFET